MVRNLENRVFHIRFLDPHKTKISKNKNAQWTMSSYICKSKYFKKIFINHATNHSLHPFLCFHEHPTLPYFWTLCNLKPMKSGRALARSFKKVALGILLRVRAFRIHYSALCCCVVGVCWPVGRT